jgi:hypothetical protein
MRFLCAFGVLFVASLGVHADEGMWLFNKPPVRQVKEAYDFEITPEWLEHLQKSSVRLGSGGSGSFVSANGLLLTNHHVAAGTIEKLSTAERNLLKDGFYAKQAGDELKCPDLELNVLMSIEDVTARVNAAVATGQSPEQSAAVRRAVIAAIEKESLDATGQRSDVVTLFQGGAYHLYRYQRYTDVRLVFAPDAQAAAFGGDPDNFEFPRYCLDFAFFRAYENGEPAKTPHFLKWKAAGAAEGELVFTSGHPGRTNRSVTLARLEAMRDDSLPHLLEQIYRNETMLRAWSDRDRENARRAKGAIVGTQNTRKASQARLNGLLDPELMQAKASKEAALRTAFRTREGLENADAAHDRIAVAEAKEREFAMRLRMLEGGEGFGSSLFGIARTLLRAGDEADKPDGERLRGYQASSRVSLELDLFSDEPIYKDLELLRLENSLTFLCAKLGANDPTVIRVLAGKSPIERAAELIDGTSLQDVATRRKLYEGGKVAVAASTDPMIALARLVDAEARELRAKAETFGEVIAQAHQEISQARFALEGDGVYPDATFTLRLSYGVVKGYHDRVPVAALTDFQGLQQRYETQGGIPPFDLSKEWLERVGELDRQVPLNFVSTNDITGGNSGSPVVNREGELVGLIFDSNAPGLVSDLAYTETQGRAVSVHPGGILEALRKIYRADRVLNELMISRNPF